MKSIVIIYHNDEDGFGGAWAAWKKFENKASYIAADFQMTPLEDIKNKEIYFIDFCYPQKEIMKKLLANNKKVVVLDHHVSAKDVCKISTEFVYGENNSGSVLAWKYFHPKKKMPKLLNYVEDGDLYRFKNKFSKEILASLFTYDLNFSGWDKIAKQLENKKTAKKFIDEGSAIMKYEKKIVFDLIRKGINVTIGGEKAIAVNSPVLESEIGNCIYNNKGLIGLIWSIRNGKMKVSLRSGGNIDVSKVANKFGGGGHKYASGFWLEYKGEFPWKTVNYKIKKTLKQKNKNG